MEQNEYKDLEEEIIKLKRELKEREEFYKNKLDQKKAIIQKTSENEKLLHELVEAAAGKIGQDFFDNIVIKLSEWLGAECVLIGQKTEEERIIALPLYLDGKISHGFSYALAGSPCDITTRKGYCSYSENVIELFPKDEILVDLQAEGYIGSALYNQNGEVNGVICAVSKSKLEVPPFANEIMKIIGARVTAEIERKKIEEELKKSEAELKESNATKDKFFSIIAHDLKNPLNSILNFSNLLMKDYDLYDPEIHKEFIKIINDETLHTANLLENLLTWSMSERGITDFNPQTIIIKKIIDETVSHLKYSASQKMITIETNIPDDLTITADKHMLSTIIRNLASNAIKFTNDGGKVKIYVERSENDVKILIEDNGIGIESHKIDSLFSMVSNSSSKGTRDEKGTGLGLILCKEFIDRHDGKIEVNSKIGEGSKFTISLKAA